VDAPALAANDDDGGGSETGGGSLCCRMRGSVPSRVSGAVNDITTDVVGDEFESDVALVVALCAVAAASARDRSAANANNDCVLLRIERVN
jgi:hypothetical protein